MAHVQGAIGVRRSVVQGEHRTAVLQTEAQINSLFGPEPLQLRFSLNGIGTHAEPGLQQVERVLVGGTSLGGVARLLAHGNFQLQWGLSALGIVGC